MEDINIFGSIPTAITLYLVFFILGFIFTIIFLIHRAMQYLDEKNQRLEEIEYDQNRPPLPPPPHTK
jgi:hypothetical protein